MKSLEILVLIPCHSLEDFPSEQTDLPAASLLNSFAVAFHPALLVAANEFPRWHRADDPPLPRRGQLIFVPTVANDWLPHGWVEGARRDGATVVADLSDRQEMIAAALHAVRHDAGSVETALDSTSPLPEGDLTVADSAPGDPTTGDLAGDSSGELDSTPAIDLPPHVNFQGVSSEPGPTPQSRALTKMPSRMSRLKRKACSIRIWLAIFWHWVPVGC